MPRYGLLPPVEFRRTPHFSPSNISAPIFDMYDEHASSPASSMAPCYSTSPRLTTSSRQASGHHRRPLRVILNWSPPVNAVSYLLRSDFESRFHCELRYLFSPCRWRRGNAAHLPSPLFSIISTKKCSSLTTCRVIITNAAYTY